MSPKHTVEHEDGCGGGLRHVPTGGLAGVCQHSLINDNGAAAADRLPLKPELELHRAREIPSSSVEGTGLWSSRKRLPAIQGAQQLGKEERDAARSSI